MQEPCRGAASFGAFAQALALPSASAFRARSSAASARRGLALGARLGRRLMVSWARIDCGAVGSPAPPGGEAACALRICCGRFREGTRDEQLRA